MTTGCTTCGGNGARHDPTAHDGEAEELIQLTQEQIGGDDGEAEEAPRVHGGLVYLDHVEAGTTNPVLLRAIAEVRAEILTPTTAPCGCEYVGNVGLRDVQVIQRCDRHKRKASR